MKEKLVSLFLDGAGHRPYRELIQEQMRKLSTRKLQHAVLWEGSNLPEDLQGLVMDYIDVITARFGYDQMFWQNATCRDAFEAIIKTAVQVFPLDDRISSLQDALRPENQELAFQLFQIPTLSFAYSASTQRAQRKFMGIRKGLFG
jgi:hypothetical protein